MHGSHHSDRMLSTGTAAYLHPDYLQPLNSSLDAKKSPLALLAQTCSSIGKDSSSSSKSLIPSLEKKDGQKHDKDSVNSRPKSGSESPSALDSKYSTDAENSKLNQSLEKTHRSSVSSRGSVSPNSNLSMSKHNSDHPTSLSRDCNSRNSAKGRGSCSPKPTSSIECEGRHARSSDTPVLQSSSKYPSASGTPSTNSLSKSSVVTGSDAARSGPPPPPPRIGSPNCGERLEGLHGALAAHQLGASYPGYPPLSYLAPHLMSHDLAASSSAYHNLLAAGKLGHLASHGASSYLNYARVKTATGASTLVPVCKDPYCSHCQVSMQSAQLHGSLPCPAGCTQCQDKSHFSSQPSLAAMHSAAAYSAALGGFSLLPTSLSSHNHSSSALASLYSHGMAAAGPASQPGLPFVCNWVSGSDYCGKRFTSSEELLQHLRSHTSTAMDTQAALSLGLPYAGLGLSPLHPHYSSAAALSSEAALRQGYPRSLSPSSALAANRYHPYKTALSSLAASPPSTSGLPPGGLVPPYLSPFSPYGPRINHAAVTP